MHLDNLQVGQFYVYVHSRPVDCEKSSVPFYVGKSKAQRLKCLERAYNFDRSYNPFYTHIIKKYGEENIQVQIYPVSSETEAFELEKDLIGLLNKFYDLANLTEGGEGTCGLAPEVAAKRAASLKGIRRTQGWKDKIAAALKDKPLSIEHRKKLSLAKLGKPTKGYPSPFKGVPRPQAVRDKISASRKGKPSPLKGRKFKEPMEIQHVI